MHTSNRLPVCVALLGIAAVVWLAMLAAVPDGGDGSLPASQLAADAPDAAGGEVDREDDGGDADEGHVDEAGRLARLRDPEIDSLLAMLDRQVAADPRNDDLLILRGQIRWQLGQIENALDDFSQAIEINPQNATAYLRRADLCRAAVLLRSGGQIMADHIRAIELNPEDHIAFCHRGVTYSQWGMIESARADFERALELKPGYVEAINNLGVYYEDIGDLDRALEHYNEALSLCPDYEAAVGNRGHVHYQQGELVAALRDQTHAIVLNPFSYAYHVDRGNTRAALGDTAGAIADYTRAIEMNRLWAALANAFEKRGELWKQLGEHEKAERDFELHRREGFDE